MPEPTTGATTEIYLKATHTRNCNYTENCNYIVLKIVQTQVDGEIHSTRKKRKDDGEQNCGIPFQKNLTDDGQPIKFVVLHVAFDMLLTHPKWQRTKQRESNPLTSKQLTPVWLKRSWFVWFSIKKQNNNFLVWVQHTTQQDDLLSAEKQATRLIEVPWRRLAAHPEGFFSSNLLWWGLYGVFDRPTLVHQS